MNKFTFLIVIILCGCNVKSQAPLSVKITVMSKVDSADLGFEILHGNYYPVRLDLINNTDSTYYFWTNSCSWQSNWVFESKTFSFAVACPKNIPELIKLTSKQVITYHGFIQCSDTTRLTGIEEDRLGFVLIKENEVEKDASFIPVLWKKIEKKKDIIWSDPLKIHPDKVNNN
jgi:hypothetical protein